MLKEDGVSPLEDDQEKLPLMPLIQVVVATFDSSDVRCSSPRRDGH